MSVEAVFKTSINDEECLVDALKSIFGDTSIEVVKDGVSVRGFRSDKKPTILIKLKGMYGTAGFYKNIDGTYHIVYDSTDLNKLSKIFPKKDGKKVIDLLNQTYSKFKIIKSFKAAKKNIAKEYVDNDGKINIRLKINQYGI